MFNQLDYQNNILITIYFKDEVGRKNGFTVNVNENLSSIFWRYINSTGKYNKRLKFLYNGKKLNPNMTVFQAGINNCSNIIVHEEGNNIGGGGFCMNFTDLSKQKFQEFSISRTSPIYRIAQPGLNICGDCKCENCIAFNNEVIIPLGRINRFDLIKERANLRCPSCRNLIEPKTVLFYLCKYKINGKNFENDKVKSFEFYGEAANKYSFQYYDPMDNGKALIIELIIEILKYL